VLILTVALATSAAAIDDAECPTLSPVIRSFEQTFDVSPVRLETDANSTCATGEFVGMSAASALSRSQLFTQQAVPVVARFSVVRGASETSRNAREMALEFRLPNGARQDMTMFNTLTFDPVDRTTFNDMIVAVKPDPLTGEPDPQKVRDFLASHPDTFGPSNFLTAHDPPASYTRSPYFSMHTFRFIDADGRTHFVRWRFIPHDGEGNMTRSQGGADGQ
jgi:catalase